MLAHIIALLGFIAAPSAETECFAFPVDYSPTECIGLNSHLVSKGISPAAGWDAVYRAGVAAGMQADAIRARLAADDDGSDIDLDCSQF